MKKQLILLSSLISTQALAADLFFRTERIFPDFELKDLSQEDKDKYYEICGESIEINVQKVVSNRPEIDAQINKNLFNQAEVNSYYQDSVGEIVELINELGAENIGVTGCMREVQYIPQYIGHYKNIEQFLISYYEYTGGAHGTSGDSYYLFDENNQQLTLNMLLENNSKTQLEERLESAYRDYIVESNGENEIKNSDIDDNYLEAVKSNTENFFFSEKGLIFSYVPYEAGAYAQGQIELLIPYEKLTGIVKAEYLP